MKRLKMATKGGLTLEEGCNKYLDNCRQRNLREGTIKHYRQSYIQFYKYFGKDLQLSDISASTYNKYVVYLRETLSNDVSINAYLRDFITTMHFLMNEGYLAEYANHNCENYPTHQLGPIAKILNITSGNRFTKLVSMSSKAVGLHEYVMNNPKYKDRFL